MKNIDKLAKMFEERENNTIITATIGEVLSMSPPRIKYGDNIILERDRLVFSNHVLNGYVRTFRLTGIDINQLSITSDGEMSFHLKDSPPAQDYDIKGFTLPTSQANQLTATMEYTNTLVPGDKVIMIPDTSLRKWFVVDKAVMV
ncbi:DUF2577 family protein [Tindallia californiensis]|uniref:DUF2577 domain-containing protein n=1 Tax=Tindallia californiensis TaxID=159292 RepID=A0A1H3R1S9_9FIRM|nr:DUF2577 family protein [Tindallia californiensis]SDZ19463.1 Protein of unknown function [Tindallia californiensis]